MRAAVVNWEVRETDSLDQYFAHCEALLKECEGAELIVLPELTSLELLGSAPGLDERQVGCYLADLLAPRVFEFGQLSRHFKCTLVAGSHFRRTDLGVINSALVATPDGSVYFDVPKVVLTQFESVDWGIAAGGSLKKLPDPRIGVTICYDSEFPESGRVLAENGVLAQCVPAFTETRHGFQRVRWSCQARALENQIFVLHASLVGSLRREPVGSTYGSSAILAPSVMPFPDSAVLAETGLGVESVAIAELCWDDLETARTSNDVRNWADRNQNWNLSEATLFQSSKP